MRKVKSKTIALIIVIIVIISIVALWVTGPIPSLIVRVSADNYVESRYSDLNLKFEEVYWSSAWQTYFASYIDEKGEIYNFKMCESFPNNMVIYDPINPPG